MRACKERRAGYSLAFLHFRLNLNYDKEEGGASDKKVILFMKLIHGGMFSF